jgi:hypothetical protein
MRTRSLCAGQLGRRERQPAEPDVARRSRHSQPPSYTFRLVGLSCRPLPTAGISLLFRFSPLASAILPAVNQLASQGAAARPLALTAPVAVVATVVLAVGYRWSHWKGLGKE